MTWFVWAPPRGSGIISSTNPKSSRCRAVELTDGRLLWKPRRLCREIVAGRRQASLLHLCVFRWRRKNDDPGQRGRRVCGGDYWRRREGYGERSTALHGGRSEERRVGKECRSRWSP